MESLEVAYGLQELLAHDAEVTVWTQGIFELTKATLDSLLKRIDAFDFGCFVFSPDDVTHIRKQDHLVARDNIVFEFGLFIGRLGEERTFIVQPDDSALRLPTDLLGISTASYEVDRRDKNLLAALGPAANRIRRTVKRLGAVDDLKKNLAVLKENVVSGISELEIKLRSLK